MSKVQHLQLLQQNLQNLLQQKEQLEAQESELNSAQQELKNSDKAYKLVGKIMITASHDQLNKELQGKTEVINLHLKNLLKQEDKLKKQIEETQKEVLKELQAEKN